MLPENVCEKCLAYMLEVKLPGWLKCLGCSYMKKKENSMISTDELLMGRAKLEDLSDEMKANCQELLRRLNLFRKEYGKPMIVSSGLRLPANNSAAGGASKSAHLTLEACDFKDGDGELKKFIEANPEVLVRCDLYQEAPESTPTWIHLQSRPTKSGNRVFRP